MHSRLAWLRKGISLALLLLAMTPAAAQGQSFPTYKGNNGRTGQNGAPDTENPGVANLTWWQQGASTSVVPSLIIDDSNSGDTTYTSAWQIASAANAASGAYFAPGASNTDAYHYAPTVASDPSSNLLALGPTAPDIATFTVGPSTTVAGNYKIYVHMPDGPTNGVSGLTPQAQYAVVQVTFADSQTFTDILNVGAYGNGWVPIGSGGAQTTRVFQYDGVTPFTVQIYNTIPRNSGGGLMDTNTPGSELVYADAVEAVPDEGSYSASPSVMQLSMADGRVVDAVNQDIQTVQQGTVQSVQQGIVYSREYNTGTTEWSWEPPGGTVGEVLDNNSGGVIATPSWTTSTTATGFYGLNYLSTPIEDSSRSGANTVTYSPTLTAGNYGVYVWVAGGSSFPQQQEVDVTSNGTTTAYTVNMSAGGGWVQLGPSQFPNSASYPLSVTITNFSSLGSDSAKTAYADAVWFAGQSTGAINSTPIQATVNINISGTITSKAVVVVATEAGKIYCLDATGNGSGGTTVYWTYPSTPDPANPTWTDPNQVTGLDGPGGVAVMPTTFDTNSGIIQHVEVSPGTYQDRLYITSQNGRIYCIDMQGRGDQDGTAPGTTTRDWSYPNDYPGTYQQSQLGVFHSSLAYYQTTDGTNAQTIYACTGQGRIYALNAVGDFGTTTRTTTSYWQYPSLSSGVAPLDPFTTTPAIDNFGGTNDGLLFVGTASVTGPGQFIAVRTDADTSGHAAGTLAWSFTGDSGNALGFFGGPATASGATINTGLTTTAPNSVFLSNQNGYIYALQADNGTELWESNAIASDVLGPISFTFLTVPYTQTTGGVSTPNSTPASVACVLVPTSTGAVYGLYAAQQLTDLANVNRIAWGYQLNGPIATDLACGYNFFYATDQTGIIYAFSSTAYSGTATPPGSAIVTGNNATQYARYNMAELKLVNQSVVNALFAGTETYADLSSAASPPPGYEYGQSVYAVLYNFPDDSPTMLGDFAATGPGYTASAQPPVQKFPSTDGTVPSDPSLSGDPRLDGFFIYNPALDITHDLQPGGLQVSASSITSPFFGATQTFALNPSQTQATVQVLNPISIVTVPLSTGGTPPGGKAIGFSVGTSSDTEGNGNPPGSQLGATVGAPPNGQSAGCTVEVIDRSLLFLLHPGTPLTANANVPGLAWQGYGSSVVNPLPAWAAGFEDLPVLNPNASYDYPDIHSNQISATSYDSSGTASNSRFIDNAKLNVPLANATNYTTRTTASFVPTQFQFQVTVPRYQPANLTDFNDGSGGIPSGNALTNTSIPLSQAGGYTGRVDIFVGMNATLDVASPTRPPFRSFYLGSGVPVDERMEMGSPLIDLKSLAGGAGFSSTSAPWGSGGSLTPLNNSDTGMFQNMQIFNTGNVNLVNVRLAKGVTPGSGTPSAITFPTVGGDPLAYLDSRVHLYSDLDPNVWDAAASATFGSSFLASGPYGPFVPKSRVGDPFPSELFTNPRQRATGASLFSNTVWPSTTTPPLPRVSVSVPLGFPAGNYQGQLTVTDKHPDPADGPFYNSTNLDIVADPTSTIKVKVVESRLTNGWSPFAAPMVDATTVPSDSTGFRNVQPTGIRDANGNLVIGWISERANPTDPAYSASTPAYVPSPAYLSASGQVLNPKWRLYVASLAGSNTNSVGSAYLSNLGDLSNFASNGGPWFGYRSGSTPDPFPDDATEMPLIFGAAPFEARVHDPAFLANPATGSPATTWLACVVDAKLQPASGSSVSKIVLAPVSVASGGQATVGSPYWLNVDSFSEKTHPSLVQLSNGDIMIFYSSGGAGQKQVEYVVVPQPSGPPSALTPIVGPTSLPLPTGFEMDSSPSVTNRLTGLAQSTTGVDVAFTGRLSGRPSSEVFLTRLGVGANNLPTGVVSFTQRTELLTAESRGFYRALGTGWTGAVNLINETTGNSVLSTVVAGGPEPVVPPSGMIVTPTTLGGNVYLDPDAGTVRLTGNLATSSMRLALVYSPSVLRVNNSSSAAHSGVSLAYDSHQVDLADEDSYWYYLIGGAAVGPTDSVTIRPGRYMFTYNRGASGAGQTARPYWKSMRLGIQLPTSVYVNPSSGGITLSVSGLTQTGYYQVDPVKGQVYFTDANGDQTLEGASPTIAYTGVDANGNPISVTLGPTPISLITEAKESAVPIDQPVNEGNLTMFEDPFEGSINGLGRPSLFWMLWASTRGTGSDIYMETLAPRFLSR